MMLNGKRRVSPVLLLIAAVSGMACGRKTDVPSRPVVDPELAKRGDIEVTARLVEVPDGAIFKRELYNYATVLKYQVVQVHRGKLDGETFYVGQYNPFKPRAEAADKQVNDVGGNLENFREGQVHRLALDGLIDDHYMGGIVNKYFGKTSDPIYWAVWTNLVSE
jgi:hypothetical protein